MQRRELSKILLASSATSALTLSTAQAQSSSGYPRTPAEISAGVTPSNTLYPQGNVLRYSADPTGAADSTAAIQSALSVAADVYLPAGHYLITSALTNAIPGRTIYGDGPQVSTLNPKGAINAIVNSANYLITMNNFGIVGDSTTLDAVVQSSGSTIDGCLFQNMFVHVGGRAFFFLEEFNTQFINCNASSYNNNVFELKGGNTTRLSGCYASQVPAGFWGYRIYGGAQLDSCTGIDTPNGGDWGFFGGVRALGDPIDAGFSMSMTNCNIEDFNNCGLRFRNTGYATISGGSIISKASGTYQAEVYVEYTGGLIVIQNVTIFSRTTRAKQAAIYMDADSHIYIVGDNVIPGSGPPQYQIGNTLYSLPVIGSSYPGYLQRAVSINNLDVAALYTRYSGSTTLSGGSAPVSFGSHAQWDRAYHVLVTGNVTETFAVTGKTVNGFTIISSNAASTATVDWMLVRTGT